MSLPLGIFVHFPFYIRYLFISRAGRNYIILFLGSLIFISQHCGRFVTFVEHSGVENSLIGTEVHLKVLKMVRVY
jgi:hypothetical protein